jgi:hypothetical protein
MYETNIICKRYFPVTYHEINPMKPKLVCVLFKNSVRTSKRTHFTITKISWLNLNSVNQLIFVMVKCGVLFQVRTGFLNII